jgi:hypothetical protein
MMSYTRSAIQLAEKYITNCSEFSILDTCEKFDDNLIVKYGTEYDIVARIYSGDSDNLTEIIRQDLFEYFKKKAPGKLKNYYVPASLQLDNTLETTIFIVGRA